MSQPLKSVCLVLTVLVLAGGCASSTPSGLRLSKVAMARGARYLARGELELAHADFSLALEYHRGNARAWNGLGILAMSRQDHVAAIAYFHQALVLDGRFVEAHANLGALALTREDPSGALPHLKRALTLHPGLASARFNLALAYLALARVPEARRELAKLRAQAPTEPRFAVHHAYALALDGAPLKALESLGQVPARGAYAALGALVRGVALMALGHRAKARAALLIALRLAPGNREARFHLALLAAVSGERERALVMLKKLLGEAVGSGGLAGVRLAYARLLIKGGNREEGRRILAALRRRHPALAK